MPAAPRKRPTGGADGGITLVDDQPVVVKGDPRRLTGSFRLRNAGDQRAIIRPVVVRDPEGGLGLPGEVTYRARARELDPDGVTEVRLRLRLDPDTPPGEYHAEVDVGGATRQLVVQVAAKVSIDLTPRRILVANRPGGATAAAVVVTNRGNVPVVIGEIGAVPLDDEQRDCRILRLTVDALTAEDREVSVERLLTEVTRASKQVLDQTGVLRVRNLTGPVEVAPGSTVRIDLEIEVPTSLDPHARYTGFLPFATRTLSFVVVPGLGGGPELSAKPKRSTRRKDAPARPSTGGSAPKPRRVSG